MGKRGQITSHIALMIVVLLVAILLSYVIVETAKGEPELPTYANNVKFYIDSCVRETLDDGLTVIGNQGGYYNTPLETQHNWFSSIPYYAVDGNIINLPTKTKVETQLALFIEDNINNCMNLSTLNENIIINDNLTSKVNIGTKSVKATIDFPITVLKGDSSKNINKFSAEIISKLNDILETAKEITDNYEEDQIDFNLLIELEEKHNLEIDIMDESDYHVYYITDENEVPVYLYMFAMS